MDPKRSPSGPMPKGLCLGTALGGSRDMQIALRDKPPSITFIRVGLTTCGQRCNTARNERVSEFVSTGKYARRSGGLNQIVA